VDVDGARVWFLQVVPLFEKEADHIHKKGFKAFEEILTFDGVAFQRLNRASHVFPPPSIARAEPPPEPRRSEGPSRPRGQR
jgi:hypothetical protein